MSDEEMREPGTPPRQLRGLYYRRKMTEVNCVDPIQELNEEIDQLREAIAMVDEGLMHADGPNVRQQLNRRLEVAAGELAELVEERDRAAVDSANIRARYETAVSKLPDGHPDKRPLAHDAESARAVVADLERKMEEVFERLMPGDAEPWSVGPRSQRDDDPYADYAAYLGEWRNVRLIFELDEPPRDPGAPGREPPGGGPHEGRDEGGGGTARPGGRPAPSAPGGAAVDPEAETGRGPSRPGERSMGDRGGVRRRNRGGSPR